MLTIKNLTRTYPSAGGTLTVLSDINLDVASGEFIAITGPSGSGKSTLLGLMAGLDKPDQGEIWLARECISQASEEEAARIRADHVGFVFQSFHLLQTLTALENVRVPAELKGGGGPDVDTRARDLLARVGLSERLQHYPAQLSGGEMQRVAIARAFMTQPAILFADEPTGNLDSRNGENVMDALIELNRDSTLVLVTHDLELAARADREIRLKDGKIAGTVVHKKKRRAKAKKKAKGQPAKRSKSTRKK